MAKRLQPVVSQLPPSATLAINERSNALIGEGRKVFKLGLGQSPFPVAAPVIEALRQHAAEKDYLPVKGLKALQEAVASYHTRVDGLPIKPHNVIVGPGSKELLFIVQMCLGGETLLPSPCWVSYEPQARLAGRSRGVVLPTTFAQRWRLQPSQVDAHCRQHPSTAARLFILNYPGNPDGLTYSPEELQALAEVFRRHNIIVASDEIYGPVHHKGEHVSLAKFYPEGTIVSGGLSKWCGAGGWRLGTFSFPDELAWLCDAMAAVASETFTAVSAPIQYAAVTAFLGNHSIDAYLHDSRRILHALGQRCARILQQAGLRVHNPEGGFYLFVDWSDFTEKLAGRGVTTGAQLCERLLQDTGVATLSGEHFMRPANELTSRLSYVNFDGVAALQAAAAIAAEQPLDDGFVDRHCGETVEALQRMANWIGDAG